MTMQRLLLTKNAHFFSSIIISAGSRFVKCNFRKDSFFTLLSKKIKSPIIEVTGQEMYDYATSSADKRYLPWAVMEENYVNRNGIFLLLSGEMPTLSNGRAIS